MALYTVPTSVQAPTINGGLPVYLPGHASYDGKDVTDAVMWWFTRDPADEVSPGVFTTGASGIGADGYAKRSGASSGSKNTILFQAGQEYPIEYGFSWGSGTNLASVTDRRGVLWPSITKYAIKNVIFDLNGAFITQRDNTTSHQPPTLNFTADSWGADVWAFTGTGPDVNGLWTGVSPTPNPLWKGAGVLKVGTNSYNSVTVAVTAVDVGAGTITTKGVPTYGGNQAVTLNSQKTLSNITGTKDFFGDLTFGSEVIENVDPVPQPYWVGQSITQLGTVSYPPDTLFITAIDPTVLSITISDGLQVVADLDGAACQLTYRPNIDWTNDGIYGPTKPSITGNNAIGGTKFDFVYDADRLGILTGGPIKTTDTAADYSLHYNGIEPRRNGGVQMFAFNSPGSLPGQAEYGCITKDVQVTSSSGFGTISMNNANAISSANLDWENWHAFVFHRCDNIHIGPNLYLENIWGDFAYTGPSKDPNWPGQNYQAMNVFFDHVIGDVCGRHMYTLQGTLSFHADGCALDRVQHWMIDVEPLGGGYRNLDVLIENQIQSTNSGGISFSITNAGTGYQSEEPRYISGCSWDTTPLANGFGLMTTAVSETLTSDDDGASFTNAGLPVGVYQRRRLSPTTVELSQVPSTVRTNQIVYVGDQLQLRDWACRDIQTYGGSLDLRGNTAVQRGKVRFYADTVAGGLTLANVNMKSRVDGRSFVPDDLVGSKVYSGDPLVSGLFVGGVQPTLASYDSGTNTFTLSGPSTSKNTDTQRVFQTIDTYAVQWTGLDYDHCRQVATGAWIGSIPDGPGSKKDPMFLVPRGWDDVSFENNYFPCALNTKGDVVNYLFGFYDTSIPGPDTFYWGGPTPTTPPNATWTVVNNSSPNGIDDQVEPTKTVSILLSHANDLSEAEVQLVATATTSDAGELDGGISFFADGAIPHIDRNDPNDPPIVPVVQPSGGVATFKTPIQLPFTKGGKGTDGACVFDGIHSVGGGGFSRLSTQDAHNTTGGPSVVKAYHGPTVPGNLLIACAMGNANSNITITESGWTGTNQSFSSPAQRVALFYKIADGTETTVTANCTGATSTQLQIYEYRGPLTPITFDAGPIGSTSTSSFTHTLASVTTTQVADLYIGVVATSGLMTNPSFTSGLDTRLTDGRLFSGDLIPITTETSLAPVGTWLNNARDGGGIIAAFKAAAPGFIPTANTYTLSDNIPLQATTIVVNPGVTVNGGHANHKYTATLTNHGTITAATTYTARWRGSVNYLPATSNPVTQVNTPIIVPPSVALSSTPASPNQFSEITLVCTVVENIDGIATFKEGITTLGVVQMTAGLPGSINLGTVSEGLHHYSVGFESSVGGYSSNTATEDITVNHSAGVTSTSIAPDAAGASPFGSHNEASKWFFTGIETPHQAGTAVLRNDAQQALATVSVSGGTGAIAFNGPLSAGFGPFPIGTYPFTIEYTPTSSSFSGSSAVVTVVVDEVAPDVTDPALIDIFPNPDDSPSATVVVPVNVVVQFTFDEPMDTTAPGFRLLKNGSTNVPGTLTWIQGDTAFTFTPTTTLDFGTQYLYEFNNSNEVHDANGNQCDDAFGPGDDWGFTTSAAPVHPHLIFHNPEDGATEVPTEPLVLLQFDRDINISTLDITFPNIDLLSLTYDPNTFTVSYFVLDALDPHMTYTARFRTVFDTFGNEADTPVEWSFTTGEPSSFLDVIADANWANYSMAWHQERELEVAQEILSCVETGIVELG